MNNYYEKKDDKGKQKSLFPFEVLPYIIKKKSLYVEILLEAEPSIENIIFKTEKVLQFGATKYEANSWQTVPNAKKRYQDAYVRHLLAEENCDIDPESNLPHEYHKICNLVFLLWFDTVGELENLKNIGTFGL